MTKPPPARQLRLALEGQGVFRAADFVVSDSNRAAYDALAAWPAARAPDAGVGAMGPVRALCGPAGSGKSHLAGLWAERLGAAPVHGEEAAFLDPLELEGRPVLLDRAQNADDETLFHLINLAYSGGGALLLVSRVGPMGWATALPDLRSRLDALSVLTLGAPDDTVLAAMLRARFAERGIRPTADVIPYLLRRIDRSAAAAAAVVAALDAAHRPVTRALAREIVGQDADSGSLFRDAGFHPG